MRPSIIIMLLTLLGCSVTDSTEEIFEPFIIGSWHVSSPSKADWRGVQSPPTASLRATSTESDTTYISKPEGQEISLQHSHPANPEFGSVMLSYTDSTVSTHLTEGNEEYGFLGVMIDFLDGIDLRSSSYFNSTEYKLEEGADYFSFELALGYDCQTRPAPSDDSTIKIDLIERLMVSPHPSEWVIRQTYIIEVPGIVEVVEYLQCGD